eukprot:TRINITY_DN8305_c0_g1_i1.p1 TRINITY_DN8305_c0_g1~~TRINITY_DN8305_c0_g1_i1.p1  ORF type:complete len:425 (-),score=82.08 TRINITY_DN8305_c0_g1_i1:40-1314(-)
MTIISGCSKAEKSRSGQELFERVREIYKHSDAPLLHSQIADYAKHKPFAGLRILNNNPVFMSSFLKLEALAVSGAELVVCTLPLFVESEAESLRLFREHRFDNLKLVEDQKEAAACGPFDLILDCCAELASLIPTFLAPPTIGFVELTQTGENVLRAIDTQNKLPYAAISIDSSRTKRLEDAFGSADGMIRALKQLLPDSPMFKPNDNNQTTLNALLFGFGKVGVGIAFQLKQHGCRVTVADVAEVGIQRAKKAGYDAVLLSDGDSLLEIVQQADLMITATGRVGAVSSVINNHPNLLSADLFKGKHLVNMGTHDEWGPHFADSDVLFNKRPINFAVEEPTKVKFLDPAFYVSHRAAELFLQEKGRYSNGLHLLTTEIDDVIINTWLAHHKPPDMNFFNSIFEALPGQRNHQMASESSNQNCVA